MTKITDLNPEIQPLIVKMCKLVGADASKIDYGKDNWYYEYEWTQKQENEFIKWMEEYVVKKKICPKHRAAKFSGMFILSYGWKTRDSR